MALEPGTRLGQYEITAVIGAGGMGEVYRARDTKLRRDVAIKVLPDDVAKNPERLARFEHEARFLASLNHPNIAAIYGQETSEGIPFLVLELVPGQSLAEKLARGPLPIDEALDVCRQVAEGLEAAHSAGVIHRDLKPANVKVTPDGKVKVLDFGLAKAFVGKMATQDLSKSPTLTGPATREGIIFGTPAYMSPEQARGGVLDKRTDIWSFGCLLYECLTGRPVFRGQTASDVISTILQTEPDWSALPDRTPPRVRDLLGRCLERSPRNRLRDIGDAGLEIEKAVAGEEWATAAESPTARRSAASRWLPVVALLLLGLAVGIGVGSLRTSSHDAEPPALRIETFSGHDSEPAASPDGQTIAFASKRDGVSRIWLKQMTGGSEAALTSGIDHFPRFSPDGSSILFAREEADGSASLFRVPVLGGNPRKVVQNAQEGDWMPDGTEVAFTRQVSAEGSTGFQAGLVGVNGDNERVIATVENASVQAPRVSPDGRWVSCRVGRYGLSEGLGRYQLLLRTDGSQTRRLHPPTRGGDVSAAAWLDNGHEIVYAQGESVTSVAFGSTLVLSGASRVLRYDILSDESRVLFWMPSLIRSLDVAGPGRLIFDAIVTRENLREFEIGAGPRAEGLLISQGASLDRQPVYSPDGEWIAFSSNRAGNLDIWARSVSTGATRRLTDDAADDWDPAYTPDGTKIIWSSRRSGNFEIWMAEKDGSGAQQVTHDGVDAENATATPDGQWLVYNSGNPQQAGLWKIRSDGTGATHLVSGTCQWPEVSPDGRYVAFAAPERGGLKVIRVARLEDGVVLPFAIELVGSQAANGRSRWMPDGGAIAFTWSTYDKPGIYVQDFHPDADTSSTRRTLVEFGPNVLPESFGISPGGGRLTIAVGSFSLSLVSARNLRDLRPPAR